MTESLLKKLEELVGTDYFESDSEDIMCELRAEGAGSEIIEALLGIMERHPLDDFGMPGTMTHFIEAYAPDCFPMLTASVQRSPALHTLWMINRCINGSQNNAEYLTLLKEIAENDQYDDRIRAAAKEYYDYQINR